LGETIVVNSVAPLSAPWVSVRVFAAAVIALPTILAAGCDSRGEQAAAEPSALFTTAQAEHGEALFAQRCAGCHGADLVGGVAPELRGPVFAESWGSQSLFARSMGRPFTVDDLAFFVSTTMPPGEAPSIAPEDHAALVAYLLQQNGYPAGTDPLTIGDEHLETAVLDFDQRSADAVTAPPPDRIEGASDAMPAGGGPTQAELDTAAASTASWLTHTHDYGGARYVALDQINADNVDRLGVVCAFQPGEMSTFQTGPIVYEGVMYLTTNTMTMAIDATTCRVKWRHTWQMQAPEGWPNNRGVAIKDGWLVRGTSDGYLLALNAENGKLVWARRVADSSKGETFTMAPLLYEDLILVGPAGSENGLAGWIGAFQRQDGSPVWRFNTVPSAEEPGADTWQPAPGIKVGGGAVWTPMTLDTGRGELYVAVTNPAPDLPADMRSGDNLYTNSLVALNVRTGTLRWYRQMVPNDDHDWDLTQVSPLISMTIDGESRNLIATAGKDGLLRTVDRDSHEVLYSTPVTTLENVDTPVSVTGTHACPGITGGVLWNGPAYNPQTGALYVGAVDWCTTFWAAQSVRFIPGRMYLGGTYQRDPTSQGWITAVDAATGDVRWKYRSPMPVLGAVTTTAGNLVFAGELTGDFIALQADTGEERYRFNTGGGIGGGIITYAIDGTQYVAVASGRPGLNFGGGDVDGTPTLFVFALH
jgi:alcohol dehydrogenase (cytochrome c)